MIKKLLLALLIGIGAIVLFIALSVAAIVGYDLYADGRADRAAEALCRTIPAGANVESVIAAAARRNDGNRYIYYEGEHHFRYQAGIFHSRECLAKSVDGKVVSVRVVKNDD